MRDEEHALASLDAEFSGASPTRCANCRTPRNRYVGLDSAIARDGTLPVFEADNAVIVHALDDPVIFTYRHRYVPRITAALDAMVRRSIRA